MICSQLLHALSLGNFIDEASTRFQQYLVLRPIILYKPGFQTK